MSCLHRFSIIEQGLHDFTTNLQNWSFISISRRPNPVVDLRLQFCLCFYYKALCIRVFSKVVPCYYIFLSLLPLSLPYLKRKVRYRGPFCLVCVWGVRCVYPSTLHTYMSVLSTVYTLVRIICVFSYSISFFRLFFFFHSFFFSVHSFMQIL